MKPQPTNPTTISTACLRAIEVLRERGWCQGTLEDPKGHVCAMGAVNIACDYDIDLVYPTLRATEKTLGGTDHVADWNDLEGNTVENVIQLLEDTAWRCRND